MCPWPRIQAALTDEWALNVTYQLRPRRAAHVAEEGGRICGRSVSRSATASTATNAWRSARPASIFATAPQLGCIQCGLCIDACDTVMKKIGRPTRLIGYDNDINCRAPAAPDSRQSIASSGRAPSSTPPSSRGSAHHAVCAADPDVADVNVLHDRNPVAVKLSDGSIRNAYTVRLLNKRGFDRVIAIDIDGPADAQSPFVGANSVTPDRPMIVLGRD